jgi:hypothetical protein
MRYSKARIRYLSRKVIEECLNEDAFDIISSDSLVVNNVMDTIESYFAIEDEVYEKVMQDLEKRKKKLIPGSAEWEISFNKAYEAEIGKRLLK